MKSPRRIVASAGSIALGAGLLGAGVVLSVPASAATSTSSYTTPGTSTFTVPAGITSVTITACGAAGGTVGSKAGGNGGCVTGTISVTAGSSLQVDVGGAGATNAGGSNGGGAGGKKKTPAAGGGGSSDVQQGGNRVFVGGGGGGASADNTGGKGGDNHGGGGFFTGGGGAQGATPGKASGGGTDGTATGTGGTGGNGGGLLDGADAGGGGGGGYAGGGGGGQQTKLYGAGGGGGGSSYAIPTATKESYKDGSQTGDGSVTITYGDTPTPTPTPTHSTASPTGTASPTHTPTANPTSTQTRSASPSPTTGTKVDLTLWGIPAQVIPGERVTVTVEATGSARAIHTTPGLTGEALVRVNGNAFCTASLENGVDSCTGIIPAIGKYVYSATFAGTGSWAGVTGQTSALLLPPKSMSESVAITAASVRYKGCKAIMSARGLESTGQKKVKVSLRGFAGWKRVAMTQTNRHGIWSANFKASGLVAIIRATDGKTVTETMIVKMPKKPKRCKGGLL